MSGGVVELDQASKEWRRYAFGCLVGQHQCWPMEEHTVLADCAAAFWVIRWGFSEYD